MKPFVVFSSLFFSFSVFANTLTRDDFINQLSVDECHRSPQSIFLDTSNEHFDLANAYSFSWIALQTLDVDSSTFDDDPDADLIHAQENWGLSNIKMIDHQGMNVRAMVTDVDDVTVIAFRHTDSNLNWLFNADYGLWNFEHSFTLGEKVHHGFGKMLGSIWEPLVEEVRARAESDRKVYVVGHSLGAALAVLASAGFEAEGIDVFQVYATGTPKVASETWAVLAQQWLVDTKVFRITNNLDLFSRIPISNLALDEFRELFTFVPDFMANAIGGLRSQMPYGVIGEHILMEMTDGLTHTDALGSELAEQDYWLTMAEQFVEIDETADNIVDNIQRKIAVVQHNLSVHLMRKENDGYTCSMINALK